MGGRSSNSNATPFLTALWLLPPSRFVVDYWYILVRTQEDATAGQLMGALIRSITVSSILIAVVALGVISRPGSALDLLDCCHHRADGWGSDRAGNGILYVADYTPTKYIASRGETGPATVIIAGLAVGMRSTAIPVIVVILGIAISFFVPGGAQNPLMGLYGWLSRR